jgi:hypothetical protein
MIHIVCQKYARLDAFKWYEATKPLKTEADALNKEFAEEALTHPDDSKDENLNGDEIQEEYVIQHSKDEEDKREDVDDEILLGKIMNEVYTCELNLFSSTITFANIPSSRPPRLRHRSTLN